MPPVTDQPVAAIVYNPIKVDVDALHSAVAEAEERSGWASSRWYETTEDDPGLGQAKRALEEGATVVVAAGGDGTIRAVAEGMSHSGVPIALLPSGTGNLLARNLNLTLARMNDSIEVAFTGVDRQIDLGRAELQRPDGSRDHHAFVVMAGLGLDARMIANTNPELKKRVGWLAYVDAIMRSLRGHNNLRVRFQLDDEPARSLHINTMLVGNCGLLPGNILLLPEAVVDDGVFDIVALRPDGFLGWVQIWVKVVWENGVLRRSTVGRKLMGLTREVRTLRYMKGTRITIRPETPQDFQLDGDAFGKVKAVRVTMDALAVTVRIPRDEADRLPSSDAGQAASEWADAPTPA